MPVTATPIGDETVDINGQPQPLSAELSRFTYPFNLSRLPALSVPCGFDRHGLPIGHHTHAERFVEFGNASSRQPIWTSRPSGSCR